MSAPYLSLNRVVVDVAVTSRKRALEEITRLLASGTPMASQAEILGSLTARERLGGTGLGHGVAIPHGRLAGISNGVGALIRLRHGIDYGESDGEFVDLVYGLIVPLRASGEQLECVDSVVKLFSDAGLRERARKASDAAALFELMQTP